MASFATPPFKERLKAAQATAATAEYARAGGVTTRALRAVKPEPVGWPHTCFGARSQVVTAARLRMGTAPLWARLHHWRRNDGTRRAEGPGCTYCGNGFQGLGPPEDRTHFLLRCPAWNGQRAVLENRLRDAGVITPVTVQVLLGGGGGMTGGQRATVASALHEYLVTTGRFRWRPLRGDAPEWVPEADGSVGDGAVGGDGDADGVDDAADDGGGKVVEAAHGEADGDVEEKAETVAEPESTDGRNTRPERVEN